MSTESDTPATASAPEEQTTPPAKTASPEATAPAEEPAPAETPSTEPTAPAEEPAPAETASTEAPAPAEEPAPAETASTEATAPAEEPAPTETASPEATAPAEEPAPTETASTEAAVPAEEPAPAETASTETAAPPEEPAPAETPTEEAALATVLNELTTTPPENLKSALEELGFSAERLQTMLKRRLPSDTVVKLRKLLTAATTSANAEDVALANQLTPFLEPRRLAWKRLTQAKETGEILDALVTEAVRGGLVTDLGVRGFIPYSQIGLGSRVNLKQHVGQTLRVRVIELDRRRNTAILSNRQVLEQERAAKRREVIVNIQPGATLMGAVRRITDIGAFVDVGGVDGLLHISEISWSRINHASDVLKTGQKIKVLVLKTDPKAGRISLSLRRLEEDPWEAAKTRFARGKVVQGTVKEIVSGGVVLQLAPEIEGFIPMRELSNERVNSAEEVCKVGQEISVSVLELRLRDRRIVLSIREIGRASQRQDMAQYRSRTKTAQRKTTLGDVFGHLFEELREEPAEKPAVEAEASVEVDTPAEAEVSAEVDAPAEAEASAEVEAPVEAEASAEVEAPVEAEVSAEVEAPVEAEASAEVEAPVEAEAAPAPEAPEAETEVEAPAADESAEPAEEAEATEARDEAATADETPVAAAAEPPADEPEAVAADEAPDDAGESAEAAAEPAEPATDSDTSAN